jgi:hypothetical protein
MVLEAISNEIFYSFHKDDILAASLLYPCKVAFLWKGVEFLSKVFVFCLSLGLQYRQQVSMVVHRLCDYINVSWKLYLYHLMDSI